MARGKLSDYEARIKGIKTWPKTFWIRSRDSVQTASSVAKKKKKHPFASWRDGPSPELEAKVYTLWYLASGISRAVLIRPTELDHSLTHRNTDGY